MMPHPERAVDPKLGATGGLGLFRSLATAFAKA
jgi:phosphoribosylformylglycinamidine (FGAM) synthase-like amidotransferase family enzyme